jgi:DNA-binding transcriptional ArsR family regulator
LVGGLSEVYETSREKIRLPGYMRMDLPLVNAIDGLIETCYNHNIKFAIIDSVAPAQSADLNSPADTTKFFTAVRKLNTAGITTLMVTHVSKGEKKNGNTKRTPFGSVFFENFPRLTWELRSEYDEQSKSFLFGVFCRKSNVGKLEPKGIKMTFLQSKVEMEYVDPEETEINDEKQTLSNLIMALLEEKDMNVKEISDVLQANPGSVRTILNRLKGKGYVTVMHSGEWSLNREKAGF